MMTDRVCLTSDQLEQLAEAADERVQLSLHVGDQTGNYAMPDTYFEVGSLLRRAAHLLSTIPTIQRRATNDMRRGING